MKKTMKANTILTFLFLLNFTYAENSFDWGQTGHRVTAEVAQNHLTENAQKQIDKLLNGISLAVASTFADEIKSERSFDKYRPWHYANIPFDKTYNQITPKPEGDIVHAIEHCISVLKDSNSTDEDKAFYLKLLIHFVGDLHQPLHLGLEEDRGANDIRVTWFNENSNLHRVWDSDMIDSYQMSYMELTNNLPKLTAEEVQQIQEGSLLDWVEEIRLLTREVYKSAKNNDRLGYRYMYDHFSTVKVQLQVGGIRLAKILNEIFD
jgi:hypothetical protein